jgi:tubulin-specific chaperone E
MSPEHHVGQRISFDGALCTVRYIGPVAGTTGTWLGVEWDDAARGKHDGSHKDVRYFTCLSKAATAASFIRPTRPADKPQSFISAVKDKYASGSGGYEYGASGPVASMIIISGKVAEEVGFDKIHRKQAQIHELKFVILDGQRVASARDEGEPGIGETCPSITQLDLSRNLLEDLRPVVEVCRELPKLANLSIK